MKKILKEKTTGFIFPHKTCVYQDNFTRKDRLEQSNYAIVDSTEYNEPLILIECDYETSTMIVRFREAMFEKIPKEKIYFIMGSIHNELYKNTRVLLQDCNDLHFFNSLKFLNKEEL